MNYDMKIHDRYVDTPIYWNKVNKTKSIDLNKKLEDQLKTYGTTIQYERIKEIIPEQQINIEQPIPTIPTREIKIQQLLNYKLNFENRYDDMLKFIEKKYPDHYNYIIDQEIKNKTMIGSNMKINPDITDEQSQQFVHYKPDIRNTRNLNEVQQDIYTATTENIEEYIRLSFYPTYQPSKQRIKYDFVTMYLLQDHKQTKKQTFYENIKKHIYYEVFTYQMEMETGKYLHSQNNTTIINMYNQFLKKHNIKINTIDYRRWFKIGPFNDFTYYDMQTIKRIEKTPQKKRKNNNKGYLKGT